MRLGIHSKLFGAYCSDSEFRQQPVPGHSESTRPAQRGIRSCFFIVKLLKLIGLKINPVDELSPVATRVEESLISFQLPGWTERQELLRLKCRHWRAPYPRSRGGSRSENFLSSSSSRHREANCCRCGSVLFGSSRKGFLMLPLNWYRHPVPRRH